MQATAVKAERGHTEEFSLVHGGPLYQLLLRTGLVWPPFGKAAWRTAVITALAWLPLPVLTMLDGTFAGGVNVPFLYDYEVHARLLVALPLLVIGELIVFIRMRAITAQFVERQIITPDTRPRFNAIVSAAMRLRNSMPVEIALLVLVIFAASYLSRQALSLRADTWYARVSSARHDRTAAGVWYAFVSVPIFRFILFRWYYRIFIWCRFLWQVSRLDLNLVATHPDRCCGLGFLGNVASAFAPILMAHSALVSGFIANRILHEGAKLPEYRFELIGVTVFLLLMVLGPLCVFTPSLNQARLAGLRIYGRLASDYVVGFAKKWTSDAGPNGEPLLGTPDIQSLADLSNSYAIVTDMKLAPFGKEAAVRFLIIIAAPLAPLALTMFSLEELMKRLVKVIL